MGGLGSTASRARCGGNGCDAHRCRYRTALILAIITVFQCRVILYPIHETHFDGYFRCVCVGAMFGFRRAQTSPCEVCRHPGCGAKQRPRADVRPRVLTCAAAWQARGARSRPRAGQRSPRRRPAGQAATVPRGRRPTASTPGVCASAACVCVFRFVKEPPRHGTAAPPWGIAGRGAVCGRGRHCPRCV